MGQAFPSLAKLPRKGPRCRYPPQFEGAFSALPHRHVQHPKADAYRAWRSATKLVVEPFQLEAAALAYGDEQKAQGKVGTQFVMMASTFFGPGERWKSYSGVPVTHVWPTGKKRGYRDPATDIDWAAEAEKAQEFAS